MCLLDRVEHWGETFIQCCATSHRKRDNPLRTDNRLAAACGIEYAAQAMAIHGALLAPQGKPPGRGYLTSVRSVDLHVARIDNLEAELKIGVERLSGDENNVLYSFNVSAAGQPLLSGRASVVLNAAARSPIFRNPD